MIAILCFGDSITFGIGTTGNTSWCDRLKNDFEVKGSHHGIYNLGISGNMSSDLLKRFDVETKARLSFRRSTSKYLILVAIGVNDSRWDGLPEDNKPRVTEEDFKKNIQKLARKATKYQAKLGFIGLTPVDEKRTLPFEQSSFKNERIKAFNEIIKQNCKKKKIPFLDMFEIMNKDNYIQLLSDGLHPNAEGYAFMYEKIKEFIEKNELI